MNNVCVCVKRERGHTDAKVSESVCTVKPLASYNYTQKIRFTSIRFTVMSRGTAVYHTQQDAQTADVATCGA